MKVSDEQKALIDEIILDKKTANITLETAMRHHSNVMNVLIKRENKWWDDFLKDTGRRECPAIYSPNTGEVTFDGKPVESDAG